MNNLYNMDGFYNWFYSQTYWLYTKILENSWFYIDYWSLVHLWFGIVIFFIISTLKIKRRWIWFSVVLILLELLAIAYVIFVRNISGTKLISDEVTDIFIGLSGGWIGCLLLRLKSEKIFFASFPQKFQIVFSSFTLAFIWVGSYHYQYNISSLNTPGLNLWAFFLWGIGGFYIIKGYLVIKKRVESIINQLIVLWILYFVALLIVEFTGYHFMHIAEVSSPNHSPLIFGLIHGSFGLHLYYLIVPFLIVAFYEIFIRISALPKEGTL